jgi:competence protein ComEC
MELALREGSEQHPALADTVVAMLLGESGALAAGQKEAYMQTGTMHLFSISGLHIAVIAAAFLFLARGLRLGERPAALLTLACLLAYVLATGARPSALRAFLMVLCHQGAHLCGRRPAPFSALVAAALLTLAWDPMQLRDAGFQLSYAVVFALLLYGAPLSQHLISRIRFFTLLPKADWRWHHKLAEWLTRTAASSLAISLAATLFSAPATLALFGLWSPGALLMNLLLIPLAGLVLIGGLIALPLGLAGFSPGASLFNHASWGLASLMDVLARAGAQIPGMWMQPSEPVGGGEAALVTTLLFASVLIAPPGHRSGWFWWTPPLLLALWMALR